MIHGMKIISGGQTGVDRGALDAALEAGTTCGGWCPAGRRAEDGVIPDRYPLEETEEADYRVRTRRNIRASDATLIIHNGELEGGTALTLAVCRELGRPCLVIDAVAESGEHAAQRLRAFVREHDVGVLNVAGPRASKWAGGVEMAREIVGRLLG